MGLALVKRPAAAVSDGVSEAAAEASSELLARIASSGGAAANSSTLAIVAYTLAIAGLASLGGFLAAKRWGCGRKLQESSSRAAAARALEELQKLRHVPAYTGELCAICFDPVSRPSDGYLFCGHNFHKKCLERRQAGGAGQICPVCDGLAEGRGPYLSVSLRRIRARWPEVGTECEAAFLSAEGPLFYDPEADLLLEGRPAESAEGGAPASPPPPSPSRPLLLPVKPRAAARPKPAKPPPRSLITYKLPPGSEAPAEPASASASGGTRILAEVRERASAALGAPFRIRVPLSVALYSELALGYLATYGSALWALNRLLLANALLLQRLSGLPPSSLFVVGAAGLAALGEACALAFVLAPLFRLAKDAAFGAFRARVDRRFREFPLHIGQSASVQQLRAICDGSIENGFWCVGWSIRVMFVVLLVGTFAGTLLMILYLLAQTALGLPIR